MRDDEREAGRGGGVDGGRDARAAATEGFFTSHPQPIVVFDPRTLELLAVNGAGCRTFGIAGDALSGLRVLDLHPGEARTLVRARYQSAVPPFVIDTLAAPGEDGSRSGPAGVRLTGTNGEFDGVINVFETVFDGKPARLALVNDVTQHERSESDLNERLALAQKVQYLAHNDPVTDLPNRERFETLLLDALSAARGANLKVAVLYLELHGFRLIHDGISQEAADDMLRAAARRLRTVAHGAQVARFGTDEFAIVTRPLSDTVEATNIAQRVVATLVEPLTLDGKTVTFRPRVGVAVYPDHADKPGDLMKAASQAKFRAKASRGPSFAVFRPGMRVRAQERLSLEGELRDALGSGQLTLYYQPRLRLADAKLVGVEALVRWRHPERGLLSPDSFVPLAEETGLIGTLGREVLDMATTQLRMWQDGGFTVPRVAVNLSPIELRSGGLIDQARWALNKARLPAERLELEVTETAALIDRHRGSEVLAAMRAMGVVVTLDDFGTGYASLTHLRELPVDSIKLDRGFLEQQGNPLAPGADLAILKAVAALGRALGVSVTAEGVETEAQLKQVVEAGCDSVQGFLVSQPVAPAFVQDAVRKASTVLDRFRVGRR